MLKQRIFLLWLRCVTAMSPPYFSRRVSEGQLGLPLASRGPRSKHRGLSRCEAVIDNDSKIDKYCNTDQIKLQGIFWRSLSNTSSIGIESCTSSRFISSLSSSFSTFYSFETCRLWQEPRVEPQRSQSVEEPPLAPMITAARQISKCRDVFCNFPAFLWAFQSGLVICSWEPLRDQKYVWQGYDCTKLIYWLLLCHLNN